ncbi:hypothetical protein C789_3256 [Microcystis aeruginosa FACHB-905 = DIANCHI905]|uniref:Uncharacterized protein n=2 Tax=Microcystis aeruginosa (strain PCC 7806) TaxID=267872 RepID=A0AB33C2K3_MICA7|nr:hypothetical protein BH695_4386 [Microcystis aeruginosa PCC 7806SL]ELS46958.1 hypothetical protein C789_3256 [Microcystis aeruginosa FACHB-905 = DIANCHI905]CAO89210.1 unnamed protein product [Microcystis aeruginosa PCC 7806]
MTRQPHDQFAKQYLEELLSPLGKVEVSKEVADETRQVDIFFSPHPNMRGNAQSLGLLGQMVTTSTLRLFSTLCDNFCLWNREMLIG